MATVGLPALGIQALDGVSPIDDLKYAVARGDTQRVNAWGALINLAQLNNQVKSTEFQQGYTLWQIADHEKALAQELSQNHAALAAIVPYASHLGMDVSKWTADKPENEMAADVAGKLVGWQIDRMNSLDATTRTNLGIKDDTLRFLTGYAQSGGSLKDAQYLATATPEQARDYVLQNPMTEEQWGSAQLYGSLMSKVVGKYKSPEQIGAAMPVELLRLLPQQRKFDAGVAGDAAAAAWGTGYVAQYDELKKQVDDEVAKLAGVQRQPETRAAQSERLDYLQRIQAALPRYLAAGAALNPKAFTSPENQYLLEKRGLPTPTQAKVQQRADDIAALVESGTPFIKTGRGDYKGGWQPRGVTARTKIPGKPGSKGDIQLKANVLLPYSDDEMASGYATAYQNSGAGEDIDKWLARIKVPAKLWPAVRAGVAGGAAAPSGVGVTPLGNVTLSRDDAVQRVLARDGDLQNAPIQAWADSSGWTVPELVAAALAAKKAKSP